MKHPARGTWLVIAMFIVGGAALAGMFLSRGRLAQKNGAAATQASTENVR